MIAAGLLLLVVGGFAAGSFYIPFKKVKNWAWESYWLVNGVFSWIVMPWLIAYLTVPQLMSVLEGIFRQYFVLDISFRCIVGSRGTYVRTIDAVSGDVTWVRDCTGILRSVRDTDTADIFRHVRQVCWRVCPGRRRWAVWLFALSVSRFAQRLG